MRLITVVIFMLFAFNYVFADDFDANYPDSIPSQIVINSENFSIIHSSNLNINDRYSYIECINKNTNEIMFHVDSPFLIHLFISDDEKYIAGISFRNYLNDYQLIILNINGEYVKQRHISAYEFRLTQNELLEFIYNYPEQYGYLETFGRIYNVPPYYYIDYFQDFNRYRKYFNENVDDYLRKYRSNNHLSDGIVGSPTLFIIWFYVMEPHFYSGADLQFLYEDDELTGISINIRANERINIYIAE